MTALHELGDFVKGAAQSLLALAILYYAMTSATPQRSKTHVHRNTHARAH
jgi:hypothetical protein